MYFTFQTRLPPYSFLLSVMPLLLKDYQIRFKIIAPFPDDSKQRRSAFCSDLI
ncbi:hypothetical protein Csa_014103 [Cucumis sativus]|uniref:Uncharacterized protein n=1 Tax=Cucumis sativus TaxID=3659 RepID=A0A0A0LRH7_CUCSA|nr:hypothetical protein Csa_014103 [Cucumis sativus]